jgi:hypothetical protein
VPTSHVPAFLHGLVDDATALPPGGAPLGEAVPDHAAHRTSTHADLLGAFVVGDVDLPDLAEQVVAEPMPVAVVVSGGAGALAPAVHWATRSDQLRLVAVHVAVRESDAGDLAPNARRIVAAIDALAASGDLDEDVAVHVEPPRLYGGEPSASWLTALDEVAAMDHRLTLRTGDPDPVTFPSAAELAVFIGAALDRELAFCAAGLHRAVRRRDEVSGLEEHGLLNMLLATRASLDGAGPAEVAALLDERDGATLTAHLDPTSLASARRWLTSSTSPRLADTVSDLTALGLIERP